MLFVFFGDTLNYCVNLVEYLHSRSIHTVFVEDSNNSETILSELNKQNIVVSYNNNIQKRSVFPGYRVIDIYIGKREDIDCFTFLEYIDPEAIQASLNIFCWKCIQPKRCLLVSPGGSACTDFLKFLNTKHIVINTPNSFIPGGDGLKHCKPDSYLVQAYNPTHVVYQYGDLDLTIRSLFRRNLLDISYFYDDLQKFMNPLKRSKKHIKFHTFGKYIEYVVEKKEEPLGIIKHWKSWRNHPNVLYIHYKDIHTSKTIDEFLGLSLGTCSEFIEQPRTSVRLDIESDEYLNIIHDIEKKERIEGPFVDEILTL